MPPATEQWRASARFLQDTVGWEDHDAQEEGEHTVDDHQKGGRARPQGRGFDRPGRKALRPRRIAPTKDKDTRRGDAADEEDGEGAAQYGKTRAPALMRTATAVAVFAIFMSA